MPFVLRSLLEIKHNLSAIRMSATWDANKNRSQRHAKLPFEKPKAELTLPLTTHIKILPSKEYLPFLFVKENIQAFEKMKVVPPRQKKL